MDELFEKILNRAIESKTTDIHFLNKNRCTISLNYLTIFDLNRILT